MKVCNKCQAEKTSESFHKDSNSRDGLYTLCKNCKKKYPVDLNNLKMWKEQNMDRVRERAREYGRERYGASPELQKRSNEKWSALNKHKISEKRRRYRNRKNNAIGSHTEVEWLVVKESCGYRCLSCKKEEPNIKLTRDHIAPLSKGGTDYIENIQPLCHSCNAKKSVSTIKY